MKILALAILAAASFPAVAQTYVNPHVRQDGTYVPGYFRSAPDSTVDNNYGTRGNYNPYTGQTGTQPRSYETPYIQRTPTPVAPSAASPCVYTANRGYVCR